MLCLAVMLVVQAMLFLWVASRAGPTAPGQPPERFAETVAAEISAALERDPALDLVRMVADEYGRDAHPVLVMMTDGRLASNGGTFPEEFVAQARLMLERRPPRGFEPLLQGRGGPCAGAESVERGRLRGQRPRSVDRGLSIVKAIVERHGATIAVESKPGRTEFRFTINGRASFTDAVA